MQYIIKFYEDHFQRNLSWLLDAGGLEDVGIEQWRMVSTSFRETDVVETNYHPTARARKEAPAPLRHYIKATQEVPSRSLYYGCGRDLPGLEALSRGGQTEVVGYDPYHPDEKFRSEPQGAFDEIVCVYTLNVVPQDVGEEILDHMASMLKPGGKALVSVRRRI
tara:strand:+ start:27018 stop:27509 length:492 start_codon:yes stop_codon:yes gene_type:complete